MYPSQQILDTEKRFLEKLRSFFLSVFPDDVLESHGLGHHDRVWRHAKELLLYPGTYSPTQNQNLPAKLIIAVYLHDIGMCIDRGPRHGIHSRRYCEIFLDENDLPAADFADLLEAVEKHDEKEYLSPENTNAVLKILSVADDLDALGYTGIYRYLEIYLMRGISYDVLGEHIAKNVSGRFSNLEKAFGDQAGFLSRHKPRYEVIMDFCRSYESQAAHYRFGGDEIKGWCGVAELIGTSLRDGTSFHDLILKAQSNVYDNTITQYFKNLSNDLTF